MKKFTLFFFALVMTFGVAMAQNSDNKWAIGVGPGVDYNLESENTGILADFYISRYLSPRFDLMLDNRLSFEEPGIDVFNTLLNLRLKLYNDDMAVQPYLFAGPGMMWDNMESGINFDAGAGLKFPVSDNTALFVSASYVKGIDGMREVDGVGADVTDDHIMVTSILEFSLGKAKGL